MDQADGVPSALCRRKASKLSSLFSHCEFYADLIRFLCLRMGTRECSLSHRRSSVLMETLEVGGEAEQCCQEY